MSNISDLLNDTDKNSSDVFSFIQEDLLQNSQTKLPEALAWYQHNANETSDYAIQKRNQKWAEADIGPSVLSGFQAAGAKRI